MSTLEIVLIVEIVLLVAIVLVLLVAMMRRDRQYSRGSANQKNPGYGYGASTVFVDNGRGYPQQVYMGGILNAPYANGQAVRMNNMQLCSGEEKTFFIPDGAHPGVSYASYPSQYDQRTVIHSVSGSGPQAAYPGTAFQNTRTAAEQQRAQTVPAQNPQSKPAHTPGSGKQPRWRIDLVEISSGNKVSREFSDILVVGRWMPSAMESGRLYLSVDATISRSQFCLYSSEDGIMIENLSNVNMTRKNGRPVWQPVRLEEGDILEFGRMRYLVKGIQPAA